MPLLFPIDHTIFVTNLFYTGILSKILEILTVVCPFLCRFSPSCGLNKRHSGCGHVPKEMLEKKKKKSSRQTTPHFPRLSPPP